MLSADARTHSQASDICLAKRKVGGEREGSLAVDPRLPPNLAPPLARSMPEQGQIPRDMDFGHVPLLPNGDTLSGLPREPKPYAIKVLLAILELLPILNLLASIAFFISLITSQANALWPTLICLTLALAFRILSIFIAFSPEPRLATFTLMYLPGMLLPHFHQITGTPTGREVTDFYDAAKVCTPKRGLDIDPEYLEPDKRRTREFHQPDKTVLRRNGPQAALLRELLTKRHGTWIQGQVQGCWNGRLAQFFSAMTTELTLIGIAFFLGPLIIYDAALRLSLVILEAKPEHRVSGEERVLQGRLSLLRLLNAACVSAPLLAMGCILLIRADEDASTGGVHGVSSGSLWLSLTCAALSILSALAKSHGTLKVLEPSSPRRLQIQVEALARTADCTSYLLGVAVRSALQHKVVAEEIADSINVLMALRKGDVEARRAEGTGVKTLRAEGYVPIELKAAFSPAELRAEGETAVDLKANEAFNADELKGNFSAAELRAAGYTSLEIMDAGFTCSEAKDAGYSIVDVQAAGFSCTEARAAGFVTGLKEAGYSCQEAKAAGPVYGLAAAGYTATEARAAGCTCAEIRTGGFSCAQAKSADFDAIACKLSGYNAKECLEAGFDIKAAGFTCSDAREATVDARACVAAGFTAGECRAAGFAAGDCKLAGCDVASCLQGGYAGIECRDGGFSALEMRNGGFWNLREAGVECRRAKAEGLNAHECKAGGFGCVEVAEAGFSALEVRLAFGIPDDMSAAWDAGFVESELVAAGFVEEINARLFRAMEVKAQEQLVLDLITPQTAKLIDEQGRLPLHCAAKTKASGKVIEALLDAFPEAIYAKTLDAGLLPLHIATMSNAPESAILALLNAYPGAMKEKSGLGHVPRDLATADSVEALLEAYSA